MQRHSTVAIGNHRTPGISRSTTSTYFLLEYSDQLAMGLYYLSYFIYGIASAIRRHGMGILIHYVASSHAEALLVHALVFGGSAGYVRAEPGASHPSMR